MPIQEAGATGAGGNLVSSILTPTALGDFALFVACTNSEVSGTPAGWYTGAGGPNYGSFLSSELPVQFVETQAFFDGNFNGWSNILCICQTNGTQPVINQLVGESGAHFTPGTVPFNIGVVPEGYSIVVYASDYTELNVGNNGNDPGLTVTDSAGNYYQMFKSGYGLGAPGSPATYTYLAIALKVPASAGLTVNLNISGTGSMSVNVATITNLVSIVGFCHGSMLL